MADKRIQKMLSEQGICSRRKAEELISAGRVKLNGRPVSLGDKMSEKDTLTIDGERVSLVKKPQRLYYALNKPRGYVTTMSDERDRKTVSDLIADVGVRLYPVGRLDIDSEGLIIMTNDGTLANAMLRGKGGFTKVYRVSVRPSPTEEQLIKLSSGVTLDDGYTTQPINIKTMSDESDRAVLEFYLHEGRNRQVRRMCAAVGLEVVRLNRVSIGPIKLSGLRTGEYRELSKEEVSALRNAAGLGR